MSKPEQELSKGVVASVVASVLFGVLFFLPPLLEPLNGNAIFGYRVLITLPVVVVAFHFTRKLGDFKVVLRRLRDQPRLIPILILDAHLLAIQLWLFGWAPQTGHGLETALGYLLLPLVMVVVGVVVHRERLSGLRIIAVALATVGVLFALVLAGGLSWVTWLVALGYPLYFNIRKVYELRSSGAFILELLILMPLVFWLLIDSRAFQIVADAPAMIPGVLLLGLVGGIALVCYLAASRMLPFGLFGLLTYLEPLLLVVVSVLLLGEKLTAVDTFVYTPILLALLLLGIEPLRRQRRRKRLT